MTNELILEYTIIFLCAVSFVCGYIYGRFWGRACGKKDKEEQ